MILKPLRNLMIAVPSKDKVNIALVPNLIRWGNQGAELAFITVPFIDNARNVAVRHFLKSKKTHLLFIDSDVQPTPDAPKKLLKAEEWIIGGWYNLTLGPTPMGTIEIKPSSFISYSENRPLYLGHPIVKDTGIKQVELLSGGFTMIHRKVFEELKEPWFETRWIDPQRTSFEGEDIGFCRKAIEKGFKIYCDTNLFAPHLKEILI